MEHRNVGEKGGNDLQAAGQTIFGGATMLELSFDVMQSCAVAAAVVLVGRAIVKRVKFFQIYCIPGVIVCGLLISLVLGLLRSNNILVVNWEIGVLKEWFMDIFFTGVGLTASWKLIKKGGARLCGGIAVAIIGLIFAQDILGILLAVPLGMHPLHGIGLGSLSLMGGVGTSGAIAPMYEELGAENAVVISVMGATFGMIFASLVGGPVARALIKRHNLSGHADEEDASVRKNGEVYPLNTKSLMGSVALIIISAGLGSYIAILAGKVPYIEFPYFIGCMLGGVIVRNVLDQTGYQFREEEVETFGSICLDLFLAMTMMTIDVTKLASVFGPFVLILTAQVVLMILWAYFVTFNTCGRNYDAAVMAAGHIGMGLGSGPNTMANERAVIAEYGPSNVAWVIFPPFALIVLDIVNPILCSLIAPWIATFA